MHAEYELALVPPEFREEALRRIASIRRFLRRPGRAAAAAHAADLGIGVAQFYNLVRSWRTLGRAELIAGQGGTRKRLAVDDAQAAFMDAIIATGAALPPRQLVDLVKKKAEEAGVELPRREIVVRYVARARPAVLPTALTDGADLVVDHTVLEMPVDFGDGVPVRPLATLAIDVGQEAILSLTLSDGQPAAAPTARALLSALRHGTRLSGLRGPAAPVISFPSGSDDDWRRLDDAFADAGCVTIHPSRRRDDVGQIVEALVGRRRAWLKLRPRLVTAAAIRRIPPRVDDRRLTDAATASRRAEQLMTSDRATGAFAGLDLGARIRLERALAVIAGC